jgi:hypothetical protein
MKIRGMRMNINAEDLFKVLIDKLKVKVNEGDLKIKDSKIEDLKKCAAKVGKEEKE